MCGDLTPDREAVGDLGLLIGSALSRCLFGGGSGAGRCCSKVQRTVGDAATRFEVFQRPFASSGGPTKSPPRGTVQIVRIRPVPRGTTSALRG